MAWKNHERPATKLCTGCKRRLPFDEDHWHFGRRVATLKDGTERTYSYAIGQCKVCRRAYVRDVEAMDNVLAGKRPKKTDQRKLAEAVWLVRKGGMSNREAAKQIGIGRSAVDLAIQRKLIFSRPPRLQLEPVLEIVKLESQRQQITLENLCHTVGFDARILRARNDSKGISVVAADALLTALGQEHLMGILEESAAV